MYINPDRLSISHQKVKGKAYTRGGIFYHHWGDDHPVLTLSGTTGFSGMKGIQTLEEIYHASGTLLKYQKFGPEKYAQRTNQQSSEVNFGHDYDSNDLAYFNSKKVDLNSPTSVVNAALETSTKQQLGDIQSILENQKRREQAWKDYLKRTKELETLTKAGNKTDTKTLESAQNTRKTLKNYYGFPDGTYAELSRMPVPVAKNATNDQKNLSIAALSNLIELNNLSSSISAISKVAGSLNNTVSNAVKLMSTNQYKQAALSKLSEQLPNIDSEVLSAVAGQLAAYYEAGTSDIRSVLGESSINSLDESPIPYRDDLAGQMISLANERQEYLEVFMQEMAKLEETEMKYYNDLRDNAFDDVMDEVDDEWRPRVIFIYYENKAYMGHFDAFSYSQEASNQLYIRYEMRITITKTIISTPK